jgi:hypothetical protein
MLGAPFVSRLATRNIIGVLSMTLEKSSMHAIAEKLTALGGTGPLTSREWRIRCRLNWHTKASSAVRHLLYGERQATLEEAREIEAAHLKYCAERLHANRAENEALLQTMRSALAAMEESDPEFFGPTLEAVQQMLLQRRGQAGEGGPEG